MFRIIIDMTLANGVSEQVLIEDYPELEPFECYASIQMIENKELLSRIF